MLGAIVVHLLWSSVVLAIMLACEHDTGAVKFEHKVLCYLPYLNSLWLIALIMTRGFEQDKIADSMFIQVTKAKDFIVSLW